MSRTSRSGFLIVGFLCLTFSCAKQEAESTSKLETPSLQFTDVTAEVGISFEHGDGKRGRQLVEDTGSGLAWGDPDNDGDFDLYVVNFGAPFGSETRMSASNRLYRNEGGRFLDVTEASGVADSSGFGMAASFADYDNDGYADIYVTNFGPNRLFRNQGDGTYLEVAASAGVDDARFSCGVSWGDLDRDGDLDLYVVNYVDYAFTDPSIMVKASDEGVDMEFPMATDPASFPPQGNALYLNQGDGTFQEVAASCGVANPEGRGLEAVMVDLDGDGWLDLYVNNDLSNNRLYRNLGVKEGLPQFEDLSESTGTADGRGSMGLGVGEFGAMVDVPDNRPDLFLTHWFTEENALYRSTDPTPPSKLAYQDSGVILALGEPSKMAVGWGAGLADFDLDGDVDILVSNGDTTEMEEDPGLLYPQPMHFYRNEGSGFLETGQELGNSFRTDHTGRGLALADFDGDGDVDVALNRNQDSLLLLRNDTQTTSQALQVRLAAPDYLRCGAMVRVKPVENGPIQTQWWVLDSSYLSGHAPQLTFALQDAEATARIEVRWADGSETTMTRVGPGVVSVQP